MKKKLQKQMDSMMEMTMGAITNNTKLVPALIYLTSRNCQSIST